ncbi:MAG TPA: VOC family protein [Vicinamibacterales bacterium]|nr:VOC family protein [Vicinamibacterales bacterium]
MPIFTHIVIGTNDLPRARQFYDAVLAPLGIRRLGNTERASVWGINAPELMVTLPANGQPATPSNGGTVSFLAPDNAAVLEFHRRALDLGGSCEGAPGPRTAVAPTAYAAYVRDFDGNKLATYRF